MSAVTSIVIVRDDLTIAGVLAESNGGKSPKDDNDLFTLVYTKRPDVIVLDCRGANRNGVRAIERIRARVGTPILVVCDADDHLQRKYRFAGAAECIEAPFDIIAFNGLLVEIARSATSVHALTLEAGLSYRFGSVQYSPGESKMSNGDAAVKLTTMENRLLTMLIQRQQKICSRREIEEMLYGPQQPANDRAIDVIVARLRKKIVDAGGTAAGELLKTEFKFGYGFVGQVAVAYASEAQVASEA